MIEHKIKLFAFGFLDFPVKLILDLKTRKT